MVMLVLGLTVLSGHETNNYKLVIDRFRFCPKIQVATLKKLLQEPFLLRLCSCNCSTQEGKLFLGPNSAMLFVAL
jgi:hypothetical protein